MTPLKLRTSGSSKDIKTEQPQAEENSQYIYPTNDLYPNYINNFCKLIRRKKKMGKRLKQAHHKREYPNVKNKI